MYTESGEVGREDPKSELQVRKGFIEKAELTFGDYRIFRQTRKEQNPGTKLSMDRDIRARETITF